MAHDRFESSRNVGGAAVRDKGEARKNEPVQIASQTYWVRRHCLLPSSLGGPLSHCDV